MARGQGSWEIKVEPPFVATVNMQLGVPFLAAEYLSETFMLLDRVIEGMLCLPQASTRKCLPCLPGYPLLGGKRPLAAMPQTLRILFDCGMY